MLTCRRRNVNLRQIITNGDSIINISFIHIHWYGSWHKTLHSHKQLHCTLNWWTLQENRKKSSSLQVWLGAPRERLVLPASTHTRLMALFPGLAGWAQYQKGKTNLDFTEARDSEWQWHQMGHTQVCTLLQTDNHASTPPLSFLQAGCPSCRPTNSVKTLKPSSLYNIHRVHCI